MSNQEFPNGSTEIVRGTIPSALQGDILRASTEEALLALASSGRLNTADHDDITLFIQKCETVARFSEGGSTFFARLGKALPDTATKVRARLREKGISFSGL